MGYSLSEKQQALSQKFKVHVMSLRLISNKLVRMAAPRRCLLSQVPNCRSGEE